MTGMMHERGRDARAGLARSTAYLDRIGVGATGEPSAAALGELHEAHLRTVPFENLSIHLGEPIVLDEAALVDKVVGGRGGYCYELNAAFGALLRTLGYRVSLLAAGVWDGDRFSPLFDHLVLRVECPEAWLVDVGFGAHSLRPLRLDARDEQTDPAGAFRIREAPAGDLVVDKDGAPQYRLETRPRELADFTMANWYQQTSPDSHFTRSLTCSRVEGDGRVTLSGRRLIRTTPEGRDEVELQGDAAVLQAYREHFGIRLSRVPEVREPELRGPEIG